MKSYVIPVLVIAFVMFGTFFMTKRHSDKQIEKLKIDNANLVGDKRYFETLVDFMSNSISMTFPSCAIVRGADTIFSDRIISSSKLLICIPATDEVCMSCVDYAISSVQSAFSNFATDSCINILSFGYNPDLKERIIKKKVFYVAQNDLSSFSAFNQVLPFYLVIDGEKHIISSFIPNMTLPKLTRDYLHNIHSYLSNE